MFEQTEVHKRDQILEKSMPFLYSLIHSILTHNQEEKLRAAILRKLRRQKRKRSIENDEPAWLPLEDLDPSHNTEESLRFNVSMDTSNDRPSIDQEIQSVDSEDDSLNDVTPTHLDNQEECDLGPSTLSKDNEYIESWNGDVYKKSRDKAENLKTRSASVSKMNLAYKSDE